MTILHSLLLVLTGELALSSLFSPLSLRSLQPQAEVGDLPFPFQGSFFQNKGKAGQAKSMPYPISQFNSNSMSNWIRYLSIVPSSWACCCAVLVGTGIPLSIELCSCSWSRLGPLPFHRPFLFPSPDLGAENLPVPYPTLAILHNQYHNLIYQINMLTPFSK